MPERIRDRAAVLIAAFCLALALPALFVPPVRFTGITLKLEGSTLVVAAVDPAARAFGEIQPGMSVLEVNYASVGDIPPKLIDQFLRGDFVELGVVDPSGGATGFTFPPEDRPAGGFVFFVGLGLLIGVATWLGRGWGGEFLRPLALPLAAAAAAPLLLAPVGLSSGWPAMIVAVALPVAALLVLASGIVARIEPRSRRRVAATVALAAATGYLAIQASGRAPGAPIGVVPEILLDAALPLAAAVTLGPTLMWLASRSAAAVSAVEPIRRRAPERLPILLGAVTPVLITSTWAISLPTSLLWLLVATVALEANVRFEAIRLQRDAVVAATEFERARLAADLHDDALQEMTVLVRRLDESGDVRAAELARSIADRLREVCGDLRLPILDELGAGPALEWLVERVRETSGHEVRLERDDATRPPADVELAVFRVAQEALANAVTHGAPPIEVRYTAAADRASLFVADGGSGIPSDAASIARRLGRHGLLNMRQRAEQVGATLEVRRPASGGTSIGLNWFSA